MPKTKRINIKRKGNIYVVLNDSGNLCILSSDNDREKYLTTSKREAIGVATSLNSIYPRTQYRVYRLDEILVVG